MFATKCPSGEEIHAYLVGKLSIPAAEDLSGHLEACVACCQTLQALSDADDTLVTHLCRTAEEAPYQQEPQCQEALARAKALVGEETTVPSPDLQALRQLGEYLVAYAHCTGQFRRDMQ